MAAKALKKRGESFAILKTDVKKAHRRIKIPKKDWRYTVAQIKGNFWVNKCGTYSVASAQWHWGRMAALLLRLTYELSDAVTWHFVYVGDFIFLIITQDGRPIGDRDAMILLFLMCSGLPLGMEEDAF